MSTPSGTRELVSLRTLVGSAAGDLRRVWRDVLAYQILLAVLSLVVLSPLVAWLFNRLAATSGNAAIGNLDIVWFLLAPTGALLGLSILSATVAIAMADVAGLVLICSGAATGKHIAYHAALRFVVARFGRILVGSLLVLSLLVATALPFVGAALLVAQSKLGEFDINYYLEVRPPEFISALRVGLVLLVLALGAAMLVALPLVFVLPEIILGERSGWAAVGASYRLAAGRRSKIALLLVLWLIAWQAASFAAGALAYGATGLAISSLGGHLGTLLTTLGIITATALTVNFGLSMLAIAIGCGLLSRLYQTAIGDVAALPAVLRDAMPLVSHARWSPRARGPIYIVAALAVVAVLVVRGVLLNTNFEDRVGIIAHRGSSLSAPENTLAAITLGIDEGATAIEIDVQRTLDGTIVVMHDADLMRVAGSPLVVQQSTYEELRAVTVQGKAIPTLDEVLDATKGRAGLLVELKSLGGPSGPLVDGVVEVLRRRDALREANVMSFVYEEVRAIKKLEPRLRVGFLASARIGDLTRLEVDFLAVSRGQATDALVAAAHSRGRNIYVWTINDRRDMETLLDRGVDSIITKKPALLVEILRERAELDPGERVLLRLKSLYLR